MIRGVAAASVAAVLLFWALRLDDGTTSGRAAAFLVACGAGVGFVLQRSQLCFTAAFRDLFLLRGRRAALGVLAALAVGSAGYAVLFGAQLPDPAWLYFVHSYAPEPADPAVVAAWCDYGRRFAAAIESGPVWATQFHPEKSGAAGLQMLGNFVAAVDGRVNA